MFQWLLSIIRYRLTYITTLTGQWLLLLVTRLYVRKCLIWLPTYWTIFVTELSVWFMTFLLCSRCINSKQPRTGMETSFKKTSFKIHRALKHYPPVQSDDNFLSYLCLTFILGFDTNLESREDCGHIKVLFYWIRICMSSP